MYDSTFDIKYGLKYPFSIIPFRENADFQVTKVFQGWWVTLVLPGLLDQPAVTEKE